MNPLIINKTKMISNIGDTEGLKSTMMSRKLQ